jgi:hypothetical protein
MHPKALAKLQPIILSSVEKLLSLLTVAVLQLAPYSTCFAALHAVRRALRTAGSRWMWFLH